MTGLNINVQQTQKVLKNYQMKTKRGVMLLGIPFASIWVVVIIVAILSENDKTGEFFSKVGYYFMGIAIFAAVVCMVVGVITLLMNQGSYEAMYKQMVAEPILKATFENVRYTPLAGYTMEEFEARRIIRVMGNTYMRSQDKIDATYNGIHFCQSDVSIYLKKRKEADDLKFRGRLIAYDLPVHVDSRVLIIKSGTPHLNLVDRGPKVELEDMEFNDMYEVYSEDGHSVFYLLTPQFMDYLKKLHSMNVLMYFSFEGNQLWLLRQCQGVFEPPIGKFDLNVEIEKSTRELAEIKKIIDVLKFGEQDPKEANKNSYTFGTVIPEEDIFADDFSVEKSKPENDKNTFDNDFGSSYDVEEPSGSGDVEPEVKTSSSTGGFKINW